MPSLDESFQQLVRLLREPAALSASRSDPFYYFVYAPEQALEVKGRLSVWTAQLRLAGIEVIRVSFSDLLWELVDASGHWDLWLELEPDEDQNKINESVRNALSGAAEPSAESGLVGKVGDIVGVERHGAVVFLTETEMLHPYFRVRTLETLLHDRIKTPTVVFYPGRRSGQYGLRFLNLYPEDGNYRATLIGGLP